MKLQFDILANGIRLVKMTGKLDGAGAVEIETKLASSCAGEYVRVIVDLSGVDFLGSIGLRLLTQTAKSVSKRCGRMALIDPIPAVQKVLEATGIPETIPLYSQLESAETVLLSY
jgi:anti-anti-sigma factor